MNATTNYRRAYCPRSISSSLSLSLFNAVRFWKSSALRPLGLGGRDSVHSARLAEEEDSGLGGPYAPEDQRCNHSCDHPFDHTKIFRFALLMTREYSWLRCKSNTPVRTLFQECKKDLRNGNSLSLLIAQEAFEIFDERGHLHRANRRREGIIGEFYITETVFHRRLFFFPGLV